VGIGLAAKLGYSSATCVRSSIPALVMGVTVEEEGDTYTIHARALVLVLGLRDIVGGAILTSLRGMEVDSGPVGEVAGKVGVVGIVKPPGLVHHHLTGLGAGPSRRRSRPSYERGEYKRRRKRPPSYSLRSSRSQTGSYSRSRWFERTQKEVREGSI